MPCVPSEPIRRPLPVHAERALRRPSARPAASLRPVALALFVVGSLAASVTASDETVGETAAEHDARASIGIEDGNYWDETALTSYAQLLASRPFRETAPLPGSFAAMDYDSYRKILFDPTRTLWRAENQPFQMELYHRGYIYPEQVRLFTIEPAGDTLAGFAPRVRAIPFDRSMFAYRGDASGILHDPEYGREKGFAGYKLIAHVPSSEWMQEVFSFIGSSYFRGLADGQVYGTSCRALAINIGMNEDEEFPAFRAFWLEKPASKDAKTFTCHALLDSPSVAGAYRFEITPGTATVADVRCRLFFRQVPEKVGLAPMSSMWMWGQGLKGPKDDHRPEVHDADGLLLHADSAWLWRPLTRQPYPSVAGLGATRLQGFGLMQRQRSEAAYNDAEARYVDRPSVWVEPLAGFTPGRVELLEFPSRFEGMDNIAAWFVPLGLFPGGKADPARPVAFAYRVTISGDDPPEHPLAKTEGFRLIRPDGTDRQLAVVGEETIEPENETLNADDPKAAAQVAQNAGPDEASTAADRTPKKVEVRIDFTGPSLENVPLERITPRVDGIRARPEAIEVKRIKRNDGSDDPETLRLSFVVIPETPYSFEMQATLFGTFPVGEAAESDGSESDGSTDERDSADSADESDAATREQATTTRPLTETWSYLCPPQR